MSSHQSEKQDQCTSSTTESVYHEILSSNNRGARQLMAGDIQNASNSFAQSLRLTKSSVSREVSTTARPTTAPAAASLPKRSTTTATAAAGAPRIACGSGTNSPTTSQTPLIVVPSPFSNNTTGYYNGDTPATPAESGPSFVYEQPIQLVVRPPPSPSELDPTSPVPVFPERQNIETVSYTVIYNLALCRHLNALALRTTRDMTQEQARHQVRANFQQAASLYAHAQTLLVLQQQHEGTRTRIMNHGAFHNMMILNNLGHVFGQLGNAAQSKQFFGTLFKAIICIKQTSGATVLAAVPSSSCLPQDSSAEGRVVEAAMDGFMSNILSFWSVSSSSSAPAA